MTAPVCSAPLSGPVAAHAALVDALLRFDVFGSVQPEPKQLVKFMESELAEATGHRAKEPLLGAAPAWFGHVHDVYVGQPARTPEPFKGDAHLLTPAARKRYLTAWRDALGDLRLALARDPGSPGVARGIYRLDVYAPNDPDRRDLIALLETELVRATNHAPDSPHAAEAWFGYLFRTYLGRNMPDFGFREDDLTSTAPAAVRRVRNAWFNFILDLREALGPSLEALEAKPAVAPPNAPQRKPRVKRPKTVAPPAAPEVETPAVSSFEVETPAEDAPVESVPPSAPSKQGASEFKPGKAPDQASIDSIVVLSDTRAQAMFLSGRYRKITRPSAAEALTHYFDLAFGEFVPGFKSTPRSFPKFAARDIEALRADAPTVAAFRAVWRELRGEVARREVLKHSRASTEGLEFISGFKAVDPLGGRLPVSSALERKDGLMDPVTVNLWLNFFRKFDRYGKISSQNGLQHTALALMLILQAHVPIEVYRESRDLVARRGVDGLLDGDYKSVKAMHPRGLDRFARVIRVFQWAIGSAQLDEPLTRESVKRTITDFETLTGFRI